MNNNVEKNIHIDLYEDRRFFVRSSPTLNKILSTCVMIIKIFIILFFSPLLFVSYVYNIKIIKYIVKLLCLFFYILLICTFFIIIKNDLKQGHNNQNTDKIILNLDYKDKIKDF